MMSRLNISRFIIFLLALAMFISPDSARAMRSINASEGLSSRPELTAELLSGDPVVRAGTEELPDGSVPVYALPGALLAATAQIFKASVGRVDVERFVVELDTRVPDGQGTMVFSFREGEPDFWYGRISSQLREMGVFSPGRPYWTVSFGLSDVSGLAGQQVTLTVTLTPVPPAQGTGLAAIPATADENVIQQVVSRIDPLGTSPITRPILEEFLRGNLGIEEAEAEVKRRTSWGMVRTYLALAWGAARHRLDESFVNWYLRIGQIGGQAEALSGRSAEEISGIVGEINALIRGLQHPGLGSLTAAVLQEAPAPAADVSLYQNMMNRLSEFQPLDAIVLVEYLRGIVPPNTGDLSEKGERVLYAEPGSFTLARTAVTAGEPRAQLEARFEAGEWDRARLDKFYPTPFGAATEGRFFWLRTGAGAVRFLVEVRASGELVITSEPGPAEQLQAVRDPWLRLAAQFARPSLASVLSALTAEQEPRRFWAATIFAEQADFPWAEGWDRLTERTDPRQETSARVRAMSFWALSMSIYRPDSSQVRERVWRTAATALRRDPSPDVRRLAVNVLGRATGQSPTLEDWLFLLVDAADDPDPEVRRELARLRRDAANAMLYRFLSVLPRPGPPTANVVVGTDTLRDVEWLGFFVRRIAPQLPGDQRVSLGAFHQPVADLPDELSPSNRFSLPPILYPFAREGGLPPEVDWSNPGLPTVWFVSQAELSGVATPRSDFEEFVVDDSDQTPASVFRRFLELMGYQLPDERIVDGLRSAVELLAGPKKAGTEEEPALPPATPWSRLRALLAQADLGRIFGAAPLEPVLDLFQVPWEGSEDLAAAMRAAGYESLLAVRRGERFPPVAPLAAPIPVFVQPSLRAGLGSVLADPRFTPVRDPRQAELVIGNFAFDTEMGEGFTQDLLEQRKFFLNMLDPATTSRVTADLVIHLLQKGLLVAGKKYTLEWLERETLDAEFFLFA